MALLDALEIAYQQLSTPATAAQWGERLHALLQVFFLAETEHDDYLLVQLQTLRETWLQTCESVGLEDLLPLTVVREAWLAGLDQGRLSQRFLAGSVNFCTLMPMRAIPFKVVCLLGMNDGDYPRAQPPLDFDLMGSDYRPGDRSRREDDRYLLLEALLSARDQLYVSWVGRSIRDNSERPASVLIGQLRDHLAGGWRLAGAKDGDKLDGGEQLLQALTVEHPLQPFSARYFHKGSSLFSYAREWRTLHLPGEEQPKVEEQLPPYSNDEALSLTLLQDFLRHPVRHFFSQRLKVFFESVEAPLADEEPFVLDALQRYSLSESLLVAALASPEDAGQALGAQARRLQGSGMLPLAGFGECLQAELVEPLPDLLQRHQQLLHQWPTALDSALPIRFEHRQLKLEGWLGRVYQRDDQSLLSITTLPNGISSGRSLKWHRLTSTWVMHLAACAVGLPLHSAVVATDVTLLLTPIEQPRAADLLGDLLLARQAGMCAPLPVAVKTAIAWLAQTDPDKALAAAAKAYEGDGQNSFGERSESTALARQFTDFAALTASEEFEGWCEAMYRPMFEAPWQTLGNEEDGQ
ncbi:RecBCD enzyme subunit RecC [compost metagenome]